MNEWMKWIYERCTIENNCKKKTKENENEKISQALPSLGMINDTSVIVIINMQMCNNIYNWNNWILLQA